MLKKGAIIETEHFKKINSNPMSSSNYILLDLEKYLSF